MERNANLKVLAQNLRKNPTKEESLLWYNFLSKQEPRFRRQYIIGNYIVDFYCHQAKLVIELDGSQHYEDEGRAADARRDAYLQSLGLRVLRYANSDIHRNFSGVCQDIWNHLPNTLSRGEGAPEGGGRGTAAEPSKEKV